MNVEDRVKNLLKYGYENIIVYDNEIYGPLIKNCIDCIKEITFIDNRSLGCCVCIEITNSGLVMMDKTLTNVLCEYQNGDKVVLSIKNIDQSIDALRNNHHAKHVKINKIINIEHMYMIGDDGELQTYILI